MKNQLIIKSARLLIAACVFTAASAFAGPAPGMLYVPVAAKDSAIAPGSHLAAVCPKCHSVFAVSADKKKSYEKAITCPACKAKLVRQEVGGRGAYVNRYVYTDDAGHEATLLRAM